MAMVPCASVYSVYRNPEAHTAFGRVNILEHSKCSGGSPGALYVNNIFIYGLYIITAKSCVRLRKI